jgi:hypothetical protein
MITIRLEEPRDTAAVRSVNEQAFGQPEEAGIVDRLRETCPEVVSLVACRADAVVGHVLFSLVTIGQGQSVIAGMGLGPLPSGVRRGHVDYGWAGGELRAQSLAFMDVDRPTRSGRESGHPRLDDPSGRRPASPPAPPGTRQKRTHRA